MKRPTLAETAIGLALAVAVGAPLGVLLAQPTPAHAVTRTCADGSTPSFGGYEDGPNLLVCQVGAIPNPPPPTPEPTPAPCISITAGGCIAPDLTRP